MGDFFEYAQHPLCLMALTPQFGGSWWSMLRPGEIWFAPDPDYSGDSEAERLGLIRKTNIRTDRGVFETAEFSSDHPLGRIDTALNLNGRTEDLTVIVKGFIPSTGIPIGTYQIFFTQSGNRGNYNAILRMGYVQENATGGRFAFVARFRRADGTNYATIPFWGDNFYLDRELFMAAVVSLTQKRVMFYMNGNKVVDEALPDDVVSLQPMADTPANNTFCLKAYYGDTGTAETGDQSGTINWALAFGKAFSEQEIKAIDNSWEELNTTEYVIDTSFSTDNVFHYGVGVSNKGPCIVEWGDGSVERLTATGWNNIAHTYAVAGRYVVRIIGSHGMIGQPDTDQRNYEIVAVHRLSESLTRLYTAFWNAVNLEYIDPGFRLHEGLDDIAYAFRGCTKLKYFPELRIPDSATSCARAFDDSAIENDVSHWFDSWTTDKARAVSHMFQNTAVRGALPPDKLWESGGTWTTTMQAFRNCTGLDNYSEIPDDWK